MAYDGNNNYSSGGYSWSIPNPNITDSTGWKGKGREVSRPYQRSPFLINTDPGSQVRIPPLRIKDKSTSPRLRRKHSSPPPSPSMTDSLETMTIESPTSALTRDYFDGRQPPSFTWPSRRQSLNLNLLTNFNSPPNQFPTRSPVMRSPLSRSMSVTPSIEEEDEENEENYPYQHHGTGAETPTSADYQTTYSPQSATGSGPFITNPLHPARLGQLPAIYTRDRLKQWGQRFLFDSRTADAFVRGAPLSDEVATSQNSIQDSNFQFSTRAEYVKIKVFPCSPAKRPFCISKKFPGRGQAGSLFQSSETVSNAGCRQYRIEKRSHRAYDGHLGVPIDVKSRRRSESDATAMLRAAVMRSSANAAALESAIEESQGYGMKVHWPDYAMHIEYALYRVPLLAAILNSGWVHRGDTIEVPMPFPEAWEDTVRWIYLFQFAMGDDGYGDQNNDKVTQNVQYLGGTID